MPEVIDYAVAHDTDFHQFMLYTPIPGTALHAQHTADKTILEWDKDYDEADIGIGGEPDGSTLFDGDLADLYFTNEYLDISVEANRREFIDASGKPVDLGVTGTNPTGSQPLLFFSGDTSSWHTNKGSGGGMTEVGALTDAATSPSD